MSQPARGCSFFPVSLFLFIAKFLIRESILFLFILGSFLSPPLLWKSSCQGLQRSQHTFPLWLAGQRCRSLPLPGNACFTFSLSHSSPGSPGLLVASQVSLLVLPCLLIPDVRGLQGSVLGSVFFPSMIPSCSGDCVTLFCLWPLVTAVSGF